MKNVPDTPLGRLYQEHIHLVKTKAVDKLIDQYHDECVLISSFMKVPAYYRGKAQLREHMNGILGIEGLETEVIFWAETDNPQTVMVTEQITMKTKEGEAHMRFADSWVLRDGKIWIHFAGMVQHADGSLA